MTAIVKATSCSRCGAVTSALDVLAHFDWAAALPSKGGRCACLHCRLARVHSHFSYGSCCNSLPINYVAQHPDCSSGFSLFRTGSRKEEKTVFAHVYLQMQQLQTQDTPIFQTLTSSCE